MQNSEGAGSAGDVFQVKNMHVIVLAQPGVAFPQFDPTPRDFYLNRCHRHRRVTPPWLKGSMILFQSAGYARGSVAHVLVRLQRDTNKTQAHTDIQRRDKMMH